MGNLGDEGKDVAPDIGGVNRAGFVGGSEP
jgi:hypothetical protein